MSKRPKQPGRSGRLAWLGVAVALAVLLAGSFLLGGRARDDAEAEAQLRAERHAVSGLASELTPEQLQADITGQAYRRLLPAVQAGILADEHVVRVRLWRPDGDLIFSTATRDDVAEFVGSDIPGIAQAAQGEPVSVVVESSSPPQPGLVAPSEDLFVTYVPLRFANEPDVAGVAEIDQLLATIEAEATRVWRPVQIGLAVALVTAAVLFVFSLRRTRSGPAAAWAPSPGQAAADERRLRDAEDRALAAERAARQAEERLKEAEHTIEQLASVDRSAETRAREEELERKLRTEEAEREQLAVEVKRLRLALTEREADLATAREATSSSDTDRAGAVEAARHAEEAARHAEERIAELEHRAAEAEMRAAEAEARAAEVEPRVSAAESRAVAAESRAEDAEARAALADSRAVDVEAKAAFAEASSSSSGSRVAELESAATRSEARLAELEAALVDADRRVADAVAEAQRAVEWSRHGEGAVDPVELERLRTEVSEARAESDVLRLEAQRAKLDLEVAGEELEGSRAELAALRAELEASRAELEASRRETAEARRMAAALEATAESASLPTPGPEVAELQRAQESLANTQVELLEATRKLRAAEDRITELETRAGEPPPEPPAPAEPSVPAGAEAEWEAFGQPAEPEPTPPAPAEPDATREPAKEPAEEPAAEPAEEGLSLRERLARAAAARHRTTPPSE